MTLEEQDLKKKAIRQTFTVFQKSSCTIILDNGLCCRDAEDEGGPAALTAIAILASIWMRRLWTLQEAVVSRKLYVAFRDRGRHWNNLMSIDELEISLARAAQLSRMSSVAFVRDLLLQNIMSRGYRESNNTVPQPVSSAMRLVVNTWRAARWRVSFAGGTDREPHVG